MVLNIEKTTGTLSSEHQVLTKVFQNKMFRGLYIFDRLRVRVPHIHFKCCGLIICTFISPIYALGFNLFCPINSSVYL